MAEAELLSVAALVKRFGATTALDHIDFTLRRGEIHALLGENGAGKSTLIKILAGVYPADEGRVVFEGREVRPEVDRLPISFIHQDLGLVDTLTVAENIALVAGFPRRRHLISWSGTRSMARAALAAIGEDIDPDRRTGQLTAGEKSLVGIARALALNEVGVILDEPTAALEEHDVVRLFAILRDLRDKGVSVIYVTHRLDEVFRVADRVTVIRDGRNVVTVPTSETNGEFLISAIVGQALSGGVARPALDSGGEVILEVRDLAARGLVPLSFVLRKGEILGLVGLRGSGHDLIGRLIFGVQRAQGGEVRLHGRLVPLGDIPAAVNYGIGFVAADRQAESLTHGLTARENMYPNLCMANKCGAMRVLPRQAERQRYRAAAQRFDIRPTAPEVTISSLSGGNQQKVVVARWLEAGCALLLLEEPTMGVDVGAKAGIHRVLFRTAAAGTGVIVTSSDFDEVRQSCNRALVFRDGRLVGDLAGASISTERLTALAGGGAIEGSIQ
ncbi:MAG: sugar ABC transporter ATP-binding protein [Candidatus Limnocylindrales bacterium]|jgi:ribose transport system ATP-binding protein